MLTYAEVSAFLAKALLPLMSAKRANATDAAPMAVEGPAVPDTDPRPTRWVVDRGKSKQECLPMQKPALFWPNPNDAIRVPNLRVGCLLLYLLRTVALRGSAGSCDAAF